MAAGTEGKPHSPRLVSFEGIDGAGKSTLLPLVEKELRKHQIPAVFTREETPGFLGDTVRQAVGEGKDPLTIVYLFLADRVQHLKDLEQPLQAGDLVVTDRYHDSTRAYQGVALAERFGGFDRFEDWLAGACEDWLVEPVRTYLLDVDSKTAVARLDGRSEVGGYEKQGFLEKVRRRYLELAEAEPGRWLVLDATKEPTALAREVVADLEKHVLVGPEAPPGGKVR